MHVELIFVAALSCWVVCVGVFCVLLACVCMVL